MMNEKEFIKRKILFEFDKYCLPNLDSIECDQTLDDLEESQNSEGSPTSSDHLNDSMCSCKCTCKEGKNKQLRSQDDEQDPLEKRRAKRREYKKRLRERVKQQKEKALKELQEIIKQIYGLKSTYLKSRQAIERCISIETNKDKFYDFINFVIREQVDAIRHEIRDCLAQLSSSGDSVELIPRLFEQFSRIKEASPQVEKIINLFIRKSFKSNGGFIPFQKNLDKMTFRFILKNDLHNRDNFGTVCEIIFQDEKKHEREKQMLKMMIEMFDDQDLDDEQEEEYSEEDENNQDQLEDSVELDKQVVENQISRDGFERNADQKSIEPLSKSRSKKKKRNNLEFDTSLESIMNRMEKLAINEDQRCQCNVSEEWIDKMRHKISKLRKNEILI